MRIRTLMPALLVGALLACESPDIVDPNNGRVGQFDDTTTTTRVTGQLVSSTDNSLAMEVFGGTYSGRRLEIVGALTQALRQHLGSVVTVEGKINGDQVEVYRYDVVYGNKP